jgi:SulP family sulfate permease
MIATVVFDLTLAIVLGIIVAIIVFVINISSIDITSAKVENNKLHTKDENVEALFQNALVVYITGPMFFMNSQKLIRKLEEIQGYRTVILSIRGVPLIDVSAIAVLSDYFDQCTQRGMNLVFCGTQDKVLHKLKTCDLYEKVGPEHFYFSVDRAITNLSYC